MKHPRLLVYVMTLLIVLAGAVPQAHADGAISGSVRDSSGSAVPGVAVSATNARTGAIATALTDSRGSFSFEGLPPGDYRVHAALPGFQSTDATATAVDGTTTSVALTLAIAPIAETVTVTRAIQTLTEVPSAVTVVTGDQLQFGERRVNAGEELEGIPGLRAENRYNLSMSGGVQLAIRAPLPASVGGLRGVQLVQDGIPITTADGTTEPTNLAFGSAGRAEIIRGPSSVLYGNSAGGVISLFTEYPASERLLIQPDVQVGSYGYQRQEVKAEGTLGTFGYLVDASRMSIDGYRTHSGGDVRQANISLRKAISSDTEIRGVFNLFDMPFGESASSLTLSDAINRPRSVRPQAITEGWGESSQQGQGGVTIAHRFDNGQELRTTAWSMWRNTWNPIPSRIIDLGRLGGGARSEYHGTVTFGRLPLEWTTGFDVSYQHDTRREFVNAGVPSGAMRTVEGALIVNQLDEVLSTAPFAEVGLALGSRWRVSAGARYDWYRFQSDDRFLANGNQSGQRNMRAASPKVGVTWTAPGDVNVYASYGTAYQTPTTLELTNRPSGEGGFNEDLNPATLKSVEVGARGLVPSLRLRYELAGYVSALDDAFVSFQRADEQTFFANAARSRRDGIEASLVWTPSARFDGRLAYTYQDFRFDRFTTGGVDYAGKQEPGTTPHQVFASGTYTAPFGLRSTARVRWLDAYPVNSANTVSDWSSTVVDLRFGLERTWNWLMWRPFLGIDNLFGERYNASIVANAFGGRYFEPAPGRQFYVGLTLGAGVN